MHELTQGRRMGGSSKAQSDKNSQELHFDLTWIIRESAGGLILV